MKKVIILPIWLALTWPVAAQGTMNFSAVLTGNIVGTGSGTFTLRTNDLFVYKVTTPFGFSLAEVRSPWPEPNAAAVFSLARIACVNPDPYPGTNLGFCLFQGSVALSDTEIDDLLAGRWYVYSQSPTAPSSPIQGQILLVPEPSSLVVFGLGLCFLATVARRCRSPSAYAQEATHDRKRVYDLLGSTKLKEAGNVCAIITFVLIICSA